MARRAFVCSKKCHAVTSMIAQKLGNEDAALYRFTHPAPQPSPAATPPPALSNTVIERNPSLPPSQHAAQTSKTTTRQGLQQSAPHQASVSSSQTPSKEGMVSVAAPDLPRKRSKADVQYAAGNAKVPIMLAEIRVSFRLYQLTYAGLSFRMLHKLFPLDCSIHEPCCC